MAVQDGSEFAAGFVRLFYGGTAAGAGIRYGPGSFDYAVTFGGAVDYGSPALYAHFLAASIEF